MTRSLITWSGVLFLLALPVAAGAYIGRTMWAGWEAPPASAMAAPERVEEWDALMRIGHQLGPATAPVVIVEFGDFECPACRTVKAQLEELQARYPTQVTLRYRQFPLGDSTTVRWAAAHAAECAANQGRFRPYYDFLFAHQDSLAQIGWKDLADRVGVPNLGQFSACMRTREFAQKLTDERAAGKRLGVDGTPTLIVQGFLWPNPPSPAVLDSVVQHVITNR